MTTRSQPANRTLLKQLLRRLRDVLSVLIKDYQPYQITLFGSWAQGDFSEESDIDLFIIKPSRLNRLERAWEAYRLLSPMKNHPMDIIVLTPREVRDRLKHGDPFVREMLRDGIVLYKKNL